MQREKDLEAATRNNTLSANEQARRSASLAAELDKLQVRRRFDPLNRCSKRELFLSARLARR